MYTKLFSDILTSSVWVESNETKIVWITLLAMADKDGEVMGSIPGTAKLAGVTIKEFEAALDVLLSPDPYSRTPDDEGRRLEAIQGGWVILNYRTYAKRANDEDRKRKAAERQRRFRERQERNADVTQSNATVTLSDEKSVTEVAMSRAGNTKIHTQTQTVDIDADIDSDSEVQTAKKQDSTTTFTEKPYEYPQSDDVREEVVVVSKISLDSFLRIAEKFEINTAFAEALWIDWNENGWKDAKGRDIASPSLILKHAWDAAQARQERNKGNGAREGWQIDADIKRVQKEIEELQKNPGSRNASLGFVATEAEHRERFESDWLETVRKIYDEATEKAPEEIAELEVMLEDERRHLKGNAQALAAFDDPDYKLARYTEAFDSAPSFEKWDKEFNKSPWKDPQGLTTVALTELRLLKSGLARLEGERREAAKSV